MRCCMQEVAASRGQWYDVDSGAVQSVELSHSQHKLQANEGYCGQKLQGDAQGGAAIGYAQTKLHHSDTSPLVINTRHATIAHRGRARDRNTFWNP